MDMSRTKCTDADIVIITDGLDDQSDMQFRGPQGAHHLVDKLRRQNIQNVSINIVGIGQLATEVSEVFENISSVTGGLYHNVSSIADLPSFSTRFVRPFANAFAAPTVHMTRARERRVGARVKIGIYDDLVANHHVEKAQQLESELGILKDELNEFKAVQLTQAERQKQDYEELKDRVAEVKAQMAQSVTKQDELKNEVVELKNLVKILVKRLPSLIRDTQVSDNERLHSGAEFLKSTGCSGAQLRPR